LRKLSATPSNGGNRTGSWWDDADRPLLPPLQIYEAEYEDISPILDKYGQPFEKPGKLPIGFIYWDLLEDSACR
jgi:hypothetical protein